MCRGFPAYNPAFRISEDNVIYNGFYCTDNICAITPMIPFKVNLLLKTIMISIIIPKLLVYILYFIPTTFLYLISPKHFYGLFYK